MSEFKKNYRWLSRFYRPLRGRFIAIAVQAVFVAVLSAAIPYVYIGIIDGLKNNLTPLFLIRSVLILLALGLLNFFASATNTIRRARTNIELEWQFRQKTFEKLIRLDQRFYEKFTIGDIVTRLTDDVGRKLSWFACSGIFRSWEALLKISFCIVAMFFINPTLTLILLIPLPLQILVYFKSSTLLHMRFKSLQGIISRVNNTIETCFSGIKIVQAYCMEERQAQKFASVAQERADAEICAERAHIFVHSLYGYFWQFGQTVVFFAGGWMVVRDKLTIGEFVAFNYYVNHLIWPMFDIGTFLVGYKRASVSIKRIRELDEYKPAIVPSEISLTPQNINGRVIFDNVTFQRNGRSVLNDVSFDTKDYRMIAVVGEIGSGKSSLLSLISRFFDPEKGEVSIDGVSLPKWSISDLRRCIGYVTQEPLLFSDTVKNNVRFGRDWIDDERIYWASDIARFTNEVNCFSNKFDTFIGLRGMTVSGGQKQRISIARALAGEPQILVLDDATSHLDAETECALWNRIYTVLPKMRIFVVSHRTATLELSDQILVLKHGSLVEQGQHKELIDRRGEYHRIYFQHKMKELTHENNQPWENH